MHNLNLIKIKLMDKFSNTAHWEVSVSPIYYVMMLCLWHFPISVFKWASLVCDTSPDPVSVFQARRIISHHPT